jgi:hypothetical protein
MLLQKRREQPDDVWTAIHDALKAALRATRHCSLLITRSECCYRFGPEEHQPGSPDGQSEATFTGLVDTSRSTSRRIFCRFKFDDGLDGPATDPWVGHFAFTFEGYARERTENRLMLDGVLHDRSGTRSRVIHEGVRDASLTRSEPLCMRLEFDPADPEDILTGLRSHGYSSMIVVRRVKFWPTVAVGGRADWAWKPDET